jgi:hypothetical protein
VRSEQERVSPIFAGFLETSKRQEFDTIFEQIRRRDPLYAIVICAITNVRRGLPNKETIVFDALPPTDL